MNLADRGRTSIAQRSNAWWKGHTANRRLSALRRAAEAGDLDAACELGEAFEARGQQAAAVEWWRVAERHGHPRAAHHLAFWHEDRGDTSRAEQLWRRAAESGEHAAAAELGRLLTDRGDTDGARRWLTPAAAAIPALGLPAHQDTARRTMMIAHTMAGSRSFSRCGMS